MLEKIKFRCGIVPEITVYDNDIQLYTDDCKKEMIASGVPATLTESDDERILTAITCYVRAYIGSDRSDTEKYLDMYHKKVFRLSLEGIECGINQ